MNARVAGGIRLNVGIAIARIVCKGGNMRLPSVKTLERVAGDRAKEVRELLEQKRKTADYHSVREWEKLCWNRPRYSERLMCALNEILGGYGVEALTRDGELTPEYEYVNMGGPYNLTIVRDCTTGRVLVTTWGDIVERWDNEKGRMSMYEMTQHYLICALWSSVDDSDNPLDENYDLHDFSPEAVERAERDCTAFLSTYSDLIGGRYQQAGHDFWLTRNHHGAGFWDGDWNRNIGVVLTNASHAFGELHVVIGDDNKLHFE